jgi:hypothetical protein
VTTHNTVLSQRTTSTVDSAVSMGEEEIEVRHGEDGVLARNLASASETIISFSDLVDLLGCLPLIDDGDVPSNDENLFDP